MRFETIFRNINLLNILLISVIIISITYGPLPLLDTKVKYTLPPAKKMWEEKKEKAVQTQTPSFEEYILIAEENLFHPERRIPVDKKEEQPLPKPEVVLYGTLITDDVSIAYLEDLKSPYSTPGRGKRQTTLREGDTISGFTLKEIEVEKIVMVRGEEKLIVYLNDSSHPKVREVTAQVTQGAPRQSVPATTPARQSVPATTPARQQPPSVSRSTPSSVQQYAPSTQKLLDFIDSRVNSRRKSSPGKTAQ